MPNPNNTPPKTPYRPMSSGFFNSFRERRVRLPDSEEQLQPLVVRPKLNLILDLDGVIVANLQQVEKDLRQRKHYDAYASVLLYFLRNSALFFSNPPYSMPQCVLPGVIELIQLLYSPKVTPYVEVSVFSAASEGRNRTLYAAILMKALGKERAAVIMSNIKMCSIDDCESLRPEQVSLLRALWGLETQQTDFGKNIYKIVSREDKNRTLLIDDNPRSICHRQVQNYCAAPSVFLHTFDPSLYGSEPCDSAESPLFQQLNSVFYLTSLIMDHVDHFKLLQNKGLQEPTVSEKLLQFHFELLPKMPTSIVQRYRPRFKENFSLQTIYDRGLGILQRINPGLSFVNYRAIQTVLEPPITDNEKLLLEKKPSMEVQEQIFFRRGSARSL